MFKTFGPRQAPSAGLRERIDDSFLNERTVDLQLTQEPNKGSATRGKKGHGHSVLIANSDQALADFLSGELHSEGYSVAAIAGSEALAMLTQRRRHDRCYDMLILDLSHSNIDALSLLRQIRMALPLLPILALAVKSGADERVAALNGGSDDCVSKPFSPKELMARISALIRRNTGVVPDCSTIGDLVLYRLERRVERSGRQINLSPKEFAILEVIMRTPGQPVSRLTLFEQVWNRSGDLPSNVVDVYMKYLRDKIDLPGETRLTHSVRGFGYELRAV
jgi:two-component system OmpR family response regulator